MPLGIQRINARQSQPNERIVFIKPLQGPDEKTAQDFLERIAAQCLPVMRDNGLSVMSLEEYEPNKEFVGRNFNAGEIIQLVLKSRSGRWLPFDYVQMVMMHELAHCKQMNHSKSFWAVRNKYAEQMRGLRARGYTGDGIWGRGVSLDTGKFQQNTVLPGELLPEHLCGGTYRSRHRKRKPKQRLSYQEQKQRRIEKKFGVSGIALGADEKIKMQLEKGKNTTAKPRMAGSARGRELRAAAALARSDQEKKEEKKEEEGDDEVMIIKTEELSSDDDGGYESDLADANAEDAVDINGQPLRDGAGRGFIKVCEDENLEDSDARLEASDLLSTINPVNNPVKAEDTYLTPAQAKENLSTDDTSYDMAGATADRSGVCAACSFENVVSATTCGVCLNVLHPRHDPGAWSCQSADCRGSSYLNPGTRSACGVCSSPRPLRGRSGK